MGSDTARIDKAVDDWKLQRGKPAQRSAQQRLLQSLRPTYNSLFERIGVLADGTKRIVDMRADLLSIIENNREAELVSLENDMKQILSDWFSVGFLKLETISWDSSASLLEKLKSHSDSVHPIDSWPHMKQRLSRGRRWFSFFHPSMPNEPLVFIEVALLGGIAADMVRMVGLVLR
jgi:malonyl-CoA decarboxylase